MDKNQLSEQLSDRVMSVELWSEFFLRNGPRYGAADLVFAGRDDNFRRVANLVLTLLVAVHDGTGNCPFKRIYVILPPVTEEDLLKEEETKTLIIRHIESVLQDKRGFVMASEELASLVAIIEVRRSQDLEMSSVLNQLLTVNQESAVIVTKSAQYRSRSEVDTGVNFSSTRRKQFPEDNWVSHIHALAVGSVAAARNMSFYIVIDADEHSPIEPENREFLNTVDDCGVLGSRPVDDSETIISTQVPNWQKLMESGAVGEAISSIDAQTEVHSDQKLLLKIQLLKNIGRPFEALTLLIPRLNELLPKLDGEMKVKIAVLAVDGEMPNLAKQILETAVLDLHSEEFLGRALSLSYQLGAKTIASDLSSRIQHLYPQSPSLLSLQIRELLGSRSYEELKKAVARPATAGFSHELLDFYDQVATALATDELPNYEGLIGRVDATSPKYSGRVRVLAAQDARARGFDMTALSLVADIDPHVEWADKGADIAIRTMERLLIARTDKGESAISNQQLRAPVTSLIRYLSEIPSDGPHRIDLVRLLSVEVAGSEGFDVIGDITYNLASKLVYNSKIIKSAKVSPVDQSEFQSFLHKSLIWLGERAPYVLGKGELPAHLINGTADSFLAILTDVLAFSSDDTISEFDVNFTMSVLHIGMLLARKSSTPDEDLTLLRLAAGKLALAGQMQNARNLAEIAVQSETISSSATRKRLAWFTFADIYHRVNNLLESLTGLACALWQDEAVVSGEQAWQEVFLLARIFRDLHLHSLARHLLPTSREMLQRLGLELKYGHRVDLLEHSIRLYELLNGEMEETDNLPAEFNTLAFALAHTCQVAAAKSDDLVPVCFLLGQVILEAESCGVALDSRISTVYENALGLLSEPMASRARTASALEPSEAAVKALLQGLENARFAEDLGFDLRPVVITARRLLSGAEARSNPDVAAFAIELLADQSVRSATDEENKIAPTSRLPESAEDLATFVKLLSLEGIVIHMMAFSRGDSLCRVTIESGNIAPLVYESHEIFSPVAFRKWCQRYPFRYANLDTAEAVRTNEFRISMENLGISHQTKERMLVVAEVSLQQLPTNLLMIDNRYSGTMLATASVPSLTWLRKARGQARIKNGRRIAWISTETRDGQPGTLDMVALRLGGTLEQYGISLFTDRVPPEEMPGSDLVIVGAHGSLVPEGRYFQVVADEGSLRMTARSLADEIAAAEVAILFVCSAARADAHPLASATVGLAKLLLDRGCQAVIASPWPLDSRVPSHWLPAFFEATTKGLPIIDATYIANQAVAQAFGDLPTRTIAMTVIGDPFVVASHVKLTAEISPIADSYLM